jgi:hypothetical protein
LETLLESGGMVLFYALTGPATPQGRIQPLIQSLIEHRHAAVHSGERSCYYFGVAASNESILQRGRHFQGRTS